MDLRPSARASGPLASRVPRNSTSAARGHWKVIPIARSTLKWPIASRSRAAKSRNFGPPALAGDLIAYG